MNLARDYSDVSLANLYSELFNYSVSQYFNL